MTSLIELHLFYKDHRAYMSLPKNARLKLLGNLYRVPGHINGNHTSIKTAPMVYACNICTQFSPTCGGVKFILKKYKTHQYELLFQCMTSI